MAPLFATILIASLVGSLHCAGMCGAFLAFAVGVDPAERRSHFHLQAAYHFGRLATYGTLGAAAGGVGAVFDLAGRTVGLQRVAMVVSAALIAGFGIVMLCRALGLRLPRAPVPGVVSRTVARAHDRVSSQPPLLRALSVGLLTTLLPCGWLYAFVAVAAGTAHPGLGAAAMGAFWIGTLPVMLTLGFAVQRIGGALGKRLPIVASSALIVVSLGSLLSRSSLIDHPTPQGDFQDPMAQVQSLLQSSGAPCHADR